MVDFLTKIRLGVIAFKEAYLTATVQDNIDWTSQGARRLRYEVLWGMYEQTNYRDVHLWATAYRKQYGLYKYVRPIYNPAYRLGQFWQGHIFGGLLDQDAGDTGAIPIATENDALREAIAQLWKWSRWNVQKDILTVRGTVLGDIAIQVCDDVNRGRVYMDILYPGSLQDVEKDPFGNVKGYTISEEVDDPQGSARKVIYTEVVNRDGINVVYETFLNGSPYAWPGNEDRTGTAVNSWQVPYGFIPLVVIQHNDVGLDWGWSELHPIRAKAQEADDIASMISDQVRKTIDPVWLMKGIKRPSSGVINMAGATDTADADRPFPGREEIQAIWNVDVNGDAVAMVADMQLESVLLHLDGILKEIERDLVELSQDISTASGDASGRALRTARQPVVSKVLQRRANYDSGLVAAQQMAVAIGGYRKYEGYEGFGLDSYERGDLDHSIVARPVFEEDPLDKIEIDSAFWLAAEQAKKAGVSLEAYLKEVGWTEERITELDIQKPEPVPQQLQPLQISDNL